jgi:hypothetical protein
MSYPEADTIQQGRQAWQRLQAAERTSWPDWLLIGRAIVVLRRDAMLDARVNKPFGRKYTAAFGAALRAAGLYEINDQDRHKIIVCLENEIEIEQWRASLDEKQRLRLNHPSAIWAHFCKAFRPNRQIEPRPRTKAKIPRNLQKPIFWSQDTLRAAAEGIRMANSQDIYIVARAALNAAFPSRDALVEALNEKPPNPSHSRRTAMPANDDKAHAAPAPA